SYTGLLAFFVVVFMTYAPRTLAGCGVNFDRMRKRRIEAIRGQILSKLGLTELPTREGSPAEIPLEIEALYNRTRDFVLEQARQQREECLVPEETYYAEEVHTVYMKNAQPQSEVQPGFKLSRGVSEFFDFDLTTMQVNPDSIVSATLRLYQVQNPGSRGGTRNQVELYQLSPPEKGGLTPVKRFLDMKMMDVTRSGWQTFDVTSSVREWIQFPRKLFDLNVNVRTGCCVVFLGSKNFNLSAVLNEGLELTIPCLGEDTFSGTQKRSNRGPRKTLDYNPHLVIMVRTPSGNSRATSSRKRRKRALDADYCFNRNPSETNCCLRELYIDFRRDLGWDWVHAPTGYRANFCAGACPYLWSMDSQHATILGLYRSMNPHASSAPCCTSKELDPLIIMYYRNNKFTVTKMSDMVLLSCKCS
uniref:TGF-beta family profile domain-containing protein n=1 Tax=Ciona savignyi TaxID=51511 RepID=H2YHT7_CIOSA